MRQLAYGATSVAITFANKAVLSVYGFKFELSLLLAQLCLGTVRPAPPSPCPLPLA